MRAARVRAPGSSPSHLGPPKARIPGPVWARRAPLMLMMRAPAVRIIKSRPRGGSSIIESAAAAPRRPKTCPNATRKACGFRSHSPANFEFPRPCRRPRKGAHHEHQRDPRDAAEGRRQSRVFHKGFAFTSSPSPGGPRPHPQKGPAALPDYFRQTVSLTFGGSCGLQRSWVKKSDLGCSGKAYLWCSILWLKTLPRTTCIVRIETKLNFHSTPRSPRKHCPCRPAGCDRSWPSDRKPENPNTDTHTHREAHTHTHIVPRILPQSPNNGPKTPSCCRCAPFQPRYRRPDNS